MKAKEKTSSWACVQSTTTQYSPHVRPVLGEQDEESDPNGTWKTVASVLKLGHGSLTRFAGSSCATIGVFLCCLRVVECVSWWTIIGVIPVFCSRSPVFEHPTISCHPFCPSLELTLVVVSIVWIPPQADADTDTAWKKQHGVLAPGHCPCHDWRFWQGEP